MFKKMKSVFSLTLLLCYFLKIWLVSLFFGSLFYYPSPPPSLSAQGGYSAPSFSPWQGSFPGIPRTVPPHRRQSESVPLTPILLWLPVYGIALLHAPSSPAPPLPSTVTCRHVLSRYSWLSSLINAPLTACGRLLLRALGELSGVSFTLMLFTPVARDPRPIDMHLFLMRVLFSWPWDM